MQNRKIIRCTWGLETLEPRVMLSATVADVEPNDRTPQQFAVPEDGLVHIVGTAAGRKDKDFFVFTAPSSGLLDVNVASPNGPVTLEIETSRGGINVLETEPNDGVNSGSAHLQAGQIYKIRLRSESKSGSPTYDVTLQFNGQTGGGGGGGGNGTTVVESEPNNTQSQANTFAFPDTGAVQLQGTSAGKKDNDFFKFSAEQSGTVTVAVAATGSLVQLEVETSNSINVFETDPKDGVNGGSFQVQAGVKYLVRLRSKSDASGAYLTDLVFTPAVQ